MTDNLEGYAMWIVDVEDKIKNIEQEVENKPQMFTPEGMAVVQMMLKVMKDMVELYKLQDMKVRGHVMATRH